MKNLLKIALTLSLSYFLTFSPSYSQNLVGNPSFEDTVACPTGVSEMDNAVGWYGTAASSDYYHTCSPMFSPVDVPTNNLGYQNPATGNAYAGFFGIEIWDGREFMGTKLTTPLNIGQKYFVSFKVSLADDTVFTISCAINNVGIIFSVDSVYKYNVNYAHIYADSIITDMINWTTVSGSFIADSAYKYMQIGNFFDNNNTDTVMISSAWPSCRSYYYVDDICVSSDSTCYVVTGIPGTVPKPAISIFPNPVTAPNFVNISGLGGLKVNIELVNMMGQVIDSYQNVRDNTILNLTGYDAGMYFISIHINETIIQQKIILVK